MREARSFAEIRDEVNAEQTFEVARLFGRSHLQNDDNKRRGVLLERRARFCFVQALLRSLFGLRPSVSISFVLRLDRDKIPFIQFHIIYPHVRVSRRAVCMISFDKSFCCVALPAPAVTPDKSGFGNGIFKTRGSCVNCRCKLSVLQVCRFHLTAASSEEEKQFRAFVSAVFGRTNRTDRGRHSISALVTESISPS